MNDLFKALIQFGPDLWKATTDTFLMVGATMVSAISMADTVSMASAMFTRWPRRAST